MTITRNKKQETRNKKQETRNSSDSEKLCQYPVCRKYPAAESGLSRKCLSLSGNKSNTESKRLQGSSIDSCKRIKSQRGVDLCYIETRLVDVSACICVRYDAGICRHKMEHTGVLVVYE